jgi:hypothetical protein
MLAKINYAPDKMSSSTMGLKVQYKSNDGKLIIKDVKCNPLNSCLSVKLEAASLFNLNDHRKHAL